MNTEESKNSVPPQEEPEQEPAKNKSQLFHKARQNMNIVFLLCAIAFILLYAIVNVSSLSGVISAVTSVLTPIILGAAIAYLLNPILKLFEKHVFRKLKNKNTIRGLSLLMTYVVAVLILVAFAFLLIPQLIQSIQELASKFDFYIATTADRINQFISNIVGNSSMDAVIDKDSLLSLITNFLSGSGSLLESIGEYVIEYGLGLVVGIKNTLIAIFISIYVLISKERLKAQAKKFMTAMLSTQARSRFYKYVSLSHKTFSSYLIGMIIDAVIVGILTLIVLLIFQVPSALLVATIVACTNVIPIFGPFIGAIPSFFIIFIEDPFKALLFVVLILIIQQVDGNIIAPKILGNSTGLSSLGVIISIIIMGEYLGVIGMILGVPIFSVIVAMVKEFLETKLHAKELPTDTAEYYDSDSLVDPHERHESLVVHIAKHISPSVHAFAERMHRKKKEKKTAKQKEESTQNKEEKEETKDHE